MWITTFGNVDWPSKPGLPVARQKREFIAYLDAARRMHFNAIFVQVQDRADAFFASQYEPWSQNLTGTPGRDPGYDPLAFMVAQAHQRGLELHAWFNPFQVSTEGDKPLPDDHPARTHPHWTHRFQGRLYYDPGLPQVRRFVQRVIIDVVRRYDIDGVHFDDHFYPYPQPGETFQDDGTYKKYGADFSGKAAWRRHNVDVFVRDAGRATHAAKPWVRFGVSPAGIWRNAESDPHGSDTSGLESHDSVYADTRTWVREGWVDYVAPQLYWSMHDPAASYRTLVRWWADLAGQAPKDRPVRLYIGQAAYRVKKSSDDPAFRTGKELERHIAENAKYSRVSGDIYFSARDLIADRRGSVHRLGRGPDKHRALPPVDERADGTAPAAVRGLRVRRRSGGADLTWTPTAGHTIRSYAVYRFDKRPDICDFADARHLVDVVSAGGGHHYADSGAKPGLYYVTALDRAGRESDPGGGLRGE